jgi:hypothetical protein
LKFYQAPQLKKLNKNVQFPNGFPSITVQDFKNQFPRGFKYLPYWNPIKQYYIGDLAYYKDDYQDSLFKALKDSIKIVPTNPDYWSAARNINKYDYVSDEDIENAFKEALMNFNSGLFNKDDIKLPFLYLAAHYLDHDIKAGQKGGGMAGFLTSYAVGDVNVGLGIPTYYMNNPFYAFLGRSPYGIKYFSMIYLLLTGNVGCVRDLTNP